MGLNLGPMKHIIFSLALISSSSAFAGEIQYGKITLFHKARAFGLIAPSKPGLDVSFSLTNNPEMNFDEFEEGDCVAYERGEFSTGQSYALNMQLADAAYCASSAEGAE